MKKSAVIVLYLMFAATGSFSQGIVSKIDELVNAYADNGQFNGVILVRKYDSVIYRKAFGLANREWNIPNTTDTKFLAGSVGKSITAFMTMILVNEGLIDLNATINTYIPDYAGPGKNKATIHQMLTHTSGIPDHGAIPNLSKKIVRWTFTSDQYLDLIKDLQLKFEPGTAFSYSGIAYNLLAIICEKVTKKEFGVLLEERLFHPLGMNNTKLDKNLDIDTRRANGYEYHLLEGYMNPSYVDMSLIKGSGGILTTADDLARFNSECFYEHKLLTKNLYEKIFTRYIKDWQYYGYGWWITVRGVGKDSLTLISHGGSTDGYKAYSTRIVNDSVDIIMFQNNYYRTELGVRFDYAITNEIIGILHGQSPELPKKSIGKEMGHIIGRDGIDAAILKFYKTRGDKSYITDDYELSQLGKELDLNYNMDTESSRIFSLALKEYPGSFLVNYNYAEFLSRHKSENASDYYRKCVECYSNSPENKEYSQEYETALARINGKK
jgi:CubicO group peptidase (beta-lactamase class C family)